ncbi:MAG: hypothetical protein MJA82_01555 [Clostridia bacterium]|nr:hypothetical protein [Clostridia bacterium]
MNRVEKIRTKKLNRLRRIKGFFAGILTFILLITLLYIGLEIVDETNRKMMYMEDPSFLSYKRLDRNNMEVVFCGDKYLVNIAKVHMVIADVKEKTEDGITIIKKFAEDKGKVVTKLVQDIF